MDICENPSSRWANSNELASAGERATIVDQSIPIYSKMNEGVPRITKTNPKTIEPKASQINNIQLTRNKSNLGIRITNLYSNWTIAIGELILLSHLAPVNEKREWGRIWLPWKQTKLHLLLLSIRQVFRPEDFSRHDDLEYILDRFISFALIGGELFVLFHYILLHSLCSLQERFD